MSGVSAMETLEQHHAIAMAKALGDRDADAFKAAARACTADEALGSDAELTAALGRGHIGRILESGIPADSVRDALLNVCRSREEFNHLAAGFAAGSVAACQGRPELAPRAAEMAAALIAILPQRVAEAVHTRSIYQMALLSADNPEALSEPIKDALYPAVERACAKRNSRVDRGFLDPDRDPAMTPAGMAALCDFKPALDSLAKAIPIKELDGGFKRLAGAVALRAHGQTPMENIASAFAHCKAAALAHAQQLASIRAREQTVPARARGQSLSAAR